MQDTSLRRVPLGYQQVTATGTAFNLPNIPAGATQAVIYVEAQAVRYRDDGTAPTTTIGAPLAVTSNGQPLYYNGNLSAIQFIAQTAGAILNILYYR